MPLSEPGQRHLLETSPDPDPSNPPGCWPSRLREQRLQKGEKPALGRREPGQLVQHPGERAWASSPQPPGLAHPASGRPFRCPCFSPRPPRTILGLRKLSKAKSSTLSWNPERRGDGGSSTLGPAGTPGRTVHEADRSAPDTRGSAAEPRRTSGSRDPGGDAPGSRWDGKGPTHPPLRGSHSSAPRPCSPALSRTPPRLAATWGLRLRRPRSSPDRPRHRHGCSQRRPAPRPPLPWLAFSASFEAVAASRRRSAPPPRRREP